MARFALDRDLLVQIHCFNHRDKVAVKDALKETKFKSNNERISRYILVSHYNSPQDKIQKLKNCKPVKVVFPSDMMLLKEETVMTGKAVRRVAREEVTEMPKEHFQSLDEEIFSLMKWWNRPFNEYFAKRFYSCKEVFFKNSTGNLLSTLKFLVGLYDLLILFSLV